MRRRWIQDPETHELIEVTPDYQAPPRQVKDSHLWNDRAYDGMRATDGADISSRSKHREYMKHHGLTTADDFKDTWAEARKKRDAYFTEGKGGAVTREDVARAIHELENRK